jgi:hypothetical protein
METIPYRGYLIRSMLTGKIFVEKDGVLIAWLHNVAMAKAIVDSLLDNHSHTIARKSGGRK